MRAVAVVPTYNEAENIDSVIAAVRSAAPEIDLLVVDDDSPDGTAARVAAIAQRDPQVRLISRSGSRGFTQAYVAGFKDSLARGYDVIIQMDCDFSHQPRYLRRLLEAIEGSDAVIGSRYIPGGATDRWPLRREVLSKLGNSYVRRILGLPFADATGGFKCWRRTALEQIDLDALKAHGFAFQMEMNFRAWKQGLRIQEIPIVFPDRVAGLSKMAMREFWESLLMPWRLKRSVR